MSITLLVCAAAAKLLQLCLTRRPHRWQPMRLSRPWDSPGKNTGVGCHFLLQCMKVKSESELSQSCPTLSDPHGLQPTRLLCPLDFQARALEWGVIAFSEIHTAAAAKSLLSCPTLCDPIDGSPRGSSVPGILQARILEWVAMPSPRHESER